MNQHILTLMFSWHLSELYQNVVWYNRNQIHLMNVLQHNLNSGIVFHGNILKINMF